LTSNHKEGGEITSGRKIFTPPREGALESIKRPLGEGKGGIFPGITEKGE